MLASDFDWCVIENMFGPHSMKHLPMPMGIANYLRQVHVRLMGIKQLAHNCSDHLHSIDNYMIKCPLTSYMLLYSQGSS